MTEIKRMPPLKTDEVILLVDTYFQILNITVPSIKKEMVQELSNSMRNLPFFTELRASPAFRSVSGMNMCLANITYIDPQKTSKMAHVSSLQRRIFGYYSCQRALLHNIANAIKAVSSLEFSLIEEYSNNVMGQLIPSYYTYLEQNNKTVKNAVKAVKLQGKTNCSVCGCDLEERYPGYGQDLLEPHITLPISQLNGNEKITMSDIIFLCPTCHKLAHSLPELIEEQNLRKSVKGR